MIYGKAIKLNERMYPEIIKPIYQEENQYSKGVKIVKEFQMPRANGKYIALCEGDDYWTSSEKLQKQYDILEKYTCLDVCSHISTVIDDKSGKIVKTTCPLQRDGIIPVEWFINAHGERVVETASLFFRRRIYEESPPFRNILTMDTTLRIWAALRGGMYFINENIFYFLFYLQSVFPIPLLPVLKNFCFFESILLSVSLICKFLSNFF